MIGKIKELFNESGEKLKTVVVITYLIEFVAYIILMFALIVIGIDEGEFGMVIFAIFMPIPALAILWALNLPLYAFAELVSNSANMKFNAELHNNGDDEYKFVSHNAEAVIEVPRQVSKTVVTKSVNCPSCGTENSVNDYHCKNCGANLKK